MMDSEGRRMNGKILTIEAEAVQMDFNHPMAGNDLFFKGQVTEVREATEEELESRAHSTLQVVAAAAVVTDLAVTDHAMIKVCDDGSHGGCGCGC